MNRIVIAVVVAAVLCWGFGCSFLKSAAIVGGTTIGGAALGSPFGPPGVAGGAVLGATAGHFAAENVELRSGELKGEEAWEKEVEYWKGQADSMEGWLKVVDKQKSAFQRGKDFLADLLKWIVVAGVAWFLWRNRHNVKALGFLRGLWHGIVGGEVGTK